jgi:hypothetical protein
VRALGVKVKRIRVKRIGVVNSQHSDDVSLKEHIVAVSICERRIERMAPSRQRRSRDELSVAIACAYRLSKGREDDELRAENESTQKDPSTIKLNVQLSTG